ncbi:hypothetical protein BRYFOR_08182 [Marvinbryantia formatexigens DSM 14469]|uniref:Uncharacterized protein n=1 Tax=Marvinbryantia formatexigens DSM 14469 TaxID=478749 RepID=C6LHR8_9FIRM|nr:hypothetical protein BRYFOR_08182 [Marvinbryantia formatexigens DSM 14469]
MLSAFVGRRHDGTRMSALQAEEKAVCGQHILLFCGFLHMRK